jgi:15-cis-phytoene synthase
VSVAEQVGPASSVDRDEAYRVCRAIARREAKNFYYAFLALPAAKHNAICAVYAFMRHADDLSDDETVPRPERRRRLAEWVADWHRAARGEPLPDPVFVALADARVRFAIPMELLDQLVQGTAMDLDPRLDESQTLDTYATFDDLYQYCYLVASVVGLVCIRIFGYGDPAAEHLAEELGVAFQLTNILRDVREDAARGRIYLPLEDLEAHGLTPQQVREQTSAPSPAMRSLLAYEAVRAERFYQSGQLLLPMIDRDSRPALAVLMRIYHRLLTRITRADYDVFSRRIRVSTPEKLAILAGGLWQVAWAKLADLGRGGRS